MKTISKLLVLFTMITGVLSCDNDNGEELVQQEVGDFEIKGTILTKRTINPENTLHARIEDFAREYYNAVSNDGGNYIGKSKVVGKDFSIILKNPENYLKEATIDSIQKSSKYITKLECAEKTIKMASLGGFILKNSGTNIAGIDRVILSTEEFIHRKTAGAEEWLVPHIIMYVYSSAALVWHKDIEKPEDLESGQDATKYVLNLKKGWNLVKIDWEQKTEEGNLYNLVTSITEIPKGKGYAWRLATDLDSEMGGGTQGEVSDYTVNIDDKKVADGNVTFVKTDKENGFHSLLLVKGSITNMDFGISVTGIPTEVGKTVEIDGGNISLGIFKLMFNAKKQNFQATKGTIKREATNKISFKGEGLIKSEKHTFSGSITSKALESIK